MRVRLGLPKDAEGEVFRFDGIPQLHRPGHSHRELELNLVERGPVVYRIGRRIHTFATGTMAWFLPGQEHKLMGPVSGHALWVATWKPELVRRLTRAPGRRWLRRTRVPEAPGSPARLLTPRAALQLRQALLRVVRARDIDERNAALGQLLVDAAGFWPAGSETAPPRLLHPAVEKALGLLEDDTLSIVRVAQKSGLSYGRLCRVFRGQTGLTPGAWRERHRIERFLRQARPGELLSAALAAGFGSYAQFYRAFRRQTGMNPRTWLAQRPRSFPR